MNSEQNNLQKYFELLRRQTPLVRHDELASILNAGKVQTTWYQRIFQHLTKNVMISIALCCAVFIAAGSYFTLFHTPPTLTNTMTPEQEVLYQNGLINTHSFVPHPEALEGSAFQQMPDNRVHLVLPARVPHTAQNTPEQTPKQSPLIAQHPASNRYSVQTVVNHNQHFPVVQSDSVREPGIYDFVEIDSGGEPKFDHNALANLTLYPTEAHKKGIEGTVMVRALIDKEGTVIKTIVEQSDATILNDAAIRAVTAIRFSPARSKGKPVPCWVTCPVKFRIDGDSKGLMVGGTPLLRLSEAELKELGIRFEYAQDEQTLKVNNTEPTYFTHLKTVSLPVPIKNEWITIRIKYIDKVVEDGKTRMANDYMVLFGDRATPTKNWYKAFYLSQSLTGEKLFFQDNENFDDENHKKPKTPLKNCLPVVLSFDSLQRRELLLWYEVTPEFIAALPERYREPLTQELSIAKKYSSLCQMNDDNERKEFDRVTAGRPFFDTWRSCIGALSITSVFPQPARGLANIQFNLEQSRSVTLSIHAINGERLDTFSQTNELSPGKHELPISLQGRSSGVYLLVLTTNKGEQAVYRILVEQ